MPEVQLQSEITCPKCGHKATETMPTDACQFFYNCAGCGERLKPLGGRLLRVLLIRHGAVSANAGGRLMLRRKDYRMPRGLKGEKGPPT
jgi:DNA-directed RNA polymerase subunit RPC12/RpoP